MRLRSLGKDIPRRWDKLGAKRTLTFFKNYRFNFFTIKNKKTINHA